MKLQEMREKTIDELKLVPIITNEIPNDIYNLFSNN